MGELTRARGAAARDWLAHYKLRRGPEAPHLGPREHVLIHESGADGTEQVGTDHALYVRDGARAESGWRRVGWGEVASVGSSRTGGTMTLRTWSQDGDSDLTLQVGERSRLPGFAAERVTACRVASRRVRIVDQCTATMSAHRNPEGGEVTWRVHLDPDCNRDDPRLAPAVEGALAELRIHFGQHSPQDM